MVALPRHEEPLTDENSNLKENSESGPRLDSGFDFADPYCVAFYRDGSVRLNSFRERPSAEAFYKNLPKETEAKTLRKWSLKVRHPESGSCIMKGSMCEEQKETLKTQGDPELCGRCEGAIRDIETTPLAYIVTFHRDEVKQAAFVDLPSAEMFYEAVPTNRDKMIMHKTLRQESCSCASLLETTDDIYRQLY